MLQTIRPTCVCVLALRDPSEEHKEDRVGVGGTEIVADPQFRTEGYST